jgi:hypothetical protein
MWQEAAEQGRDIAADLAEERRVATLVGLRARYAQTLDAAQKAEAERRRAALGAELDRRACERLQ